MLTMQYLSRLVAVIWLAGSLPMVAAQDFVAAEPPAVDFDSVVARFTKVGYTEVEAANFARLALGMPQASSGGCAYYDVRAFYCNGETVVWEDYRVGIRCIRQKLASCNLQPCPTGTDRFFKTKTSADCDPPATCVLLRISGMKTSSDEHICETLKNCDCWPDLACATAVCAAIDPDTLVPVDCPKCD